MCISRSHYLFLEIGPQLFILINKKQGQTSPGGYRHLFMMGKTNYQIKLDSGHSKFIYRRCFVRELLRRPDDMDRCFPSLLAEGGRECFLILRSRSFLICSLAFKPISGSLPLAGCLERDDSGSIRLTSDFRNLTRWDPKLYSFRDV